MILVVNPARSICSWDVQFIWEVGELDRSVLDLFVVGDC